MTKEEEDEITKELKNDPQYEDIFKDSDTNSTEYDGDEDDLDEQAMKYTTDTNQEFEELAGIENIQKEMAEIDQIIKSIQPLLDDIDTQETEKEMEIEENSKKSEGETGDNQKKD